MDHHEFNFGRPAARAEHYRERIVEACAHWPNEKVKVHVELPQFDGERQGGYVKGVAGRASFLTVVFLLGCGTASGANPNPSGEASSGATERSPMQPSTTTIANDVEALVSTDLRIDGPVAEIPAGRLGRLHAWPGLYMAALEDRFVADADSRAFRAEHDPASGRNVALPLELLYPMFPERVRAVADHILIRWSAINSATGSPVDGPQSFALSILQSGIDVELPQDPESASGVWVDQACVTTTQLGRSLLRVRGCTCSKPISCRVGREGRQLTVEVLEGPGLGVCTDCLQVFAACSVPTLPPGTELTVELSVNGEVPEGHNLKKTIQTDPAGRLPFNRCR